MRLAMDEATSTEAAEIRLVVKKMDPSDPSGRENLRLKKYVIQDLRDMSVSSNYTDSRAELERVAKPLGGNIQRRQSRGERVQSEQNRKSQKQGDDLGIAEERKNRFLLLRLLLLGGGVARLIAQQRLSFTLISRLSRRLLLLSLHSGAQSNRQEKLERANSGIGEEDDSTGGNIGPSPDNLKQVDGPSASHHAQSGSRIANERVPCEDIAQDVIGGQMGQS